MLEAFLLTKYVFFGKSSERYNVTFFQTRMTSCQWGLTSNGLTSNETIEKVVGEGYLLVFLQRELKKIDNFNHPQGCPLQKIATYISMNFLKYFQQFDI